MQKAYIFSTLNNELQFDNDGISTINISYDLEDNLYNGCFQQSQNLSFTIKELPENFDITLHQAKYDIDKKEWRLEDKKIQGEFYEKTTGTKFTEILVKDIALYTNIVPLPSYDDGTTQAFNEETQTWSYTYKGLGIQKQEKLETLKQKYNESQTITIQNGETLIIKHDTPERKHFYKHLSFAENLQQNDRNNAIKSYQQKVDNKIYQLDFLNEIWQFMFKDIFKIKKNDILIDVEVANKLQYNQCELRIQNAATIEALNVIEWHFVVVPVIDINQKAQALLGNSEISEKSKNAIEARRDKDDPTQFHLIRVYE